MRTDHDHLGPGSLHSEPSPFRGHRPTGAWYARTIIVTLFLLSGAAIAPSATKADITYTLENYTADQSGHTVTGTITTDGVTGTITDADIESWTVTIDTTTFSSTMTGASVQLFGTHVQASTTAITLAAGTNISPNASLELRVITLALADIILYNRPFSEAPNYAGVVNSATLWNTTNPSMGGTDPWVIATAATAVPEPSTAIAAGFGAVAFLAYGWYRHRREQRRQGAA